MQSIFFHHHQWIKPFSCTSLAKNKCFPYKNRAMWHRSSHVTSAFRVNIFSITTHKGQHFNTWRQLLTIHTISIAVAYLSWPHRLSVTLHLFFGRFSKTESDIFIRTIESLDHTFFLKNKKDYPSWIILLGVIGFEYSDRIFTHSKIIKQMKIWFLESQRNLW